MFSLSQWQSDSAAYSWAQREDILLLVQASPYAAQQLLNQPEILDLFDCDWQDFDFSTVGSFWKDCGDEATLMRELRRCKHRYQSALIYALLCRGLSQSAFLRNLSALAAALVEAALLWQERQLQTRYGQPLDENGNPLRLTILGMGKLGGAELNFSSDIVLIFAYRNQGETQAAAGQKSIEHEVFFRKLAQKLIACLDQMTAEGFVYRVDMRLRPFGQTGPLALSYTALENYYQNHGRDWERYAMMKARPVAGDIEGGMALLGQLRPFMYRRYLDYAALDSIAQMKHSINQQIRAQGMENHIKLGRGGIREAEFSVQAMQLVYGGQYPTLQSPHFLGVLEDLHRLNLWQAQECQALREAYLLLRTVENALQFAHEQQVHELPPIDDSAAWLRLSLACRFDSVEALQAALNQARETVDQRFRRIFASTENDTAAENSISANWQQINGEQLRADLIAQDYSAEQAAAISHALQQFSAALPWQRLSEKAGKRIETLLPLLLHIAAQEKAEAAAIGEILALIETVASRSVYIDMLSGNPQLIRHLLAIARDSRGLMEFIREHPLVIDDILSERSLIQDATQLDKDLSARLANTDDENWLHAIRDFKHAQLFKIAWAELYGNLPLMAASDHLSHLAELIIDKALQRAWQQLRQRHGIPRSSDGEAARFAIIAYGKLGGLELSYTSDIDLVYLYDDKRSQGSTDGEKSIANQVFFTRLVQRINNLLSAPSTSGVLYEIDTRLRPGGRSGMLIASIEAFADYQQKQAWTWEHQALTRARPIGGDVSLCAEFSVLRQTVLQKAPPADLRRQVLDMREKMQNNEHLAKEGFHLKKSVGGLIDIEFIVQYLLLKHAHQEPILLRMSDNIRQLAALEATGLLSSIDANTLRDAYRRLRQAAHRRALNRQSNVADSLEWQNTINHVCRIWRKVFEIN